ncbi:MAG: UDP-N-acetylmuramoyl-tripeptide--D-alanyl-D-alanine ligase [Calditrichaeota bacterium]|nr:MAG: UDP-N-acetylmuramoyl-tripeptide--D-alanyl-D-alanine ligase [Calditrichota bacterium]
MGDKTPKDLYSDEISLIPPTGSREFIELNLKQILKRRRQFNIPVIGIAGSDGKTTTKRMISAILSSFYNILETPMQCVTTAGLTSTILQLNEKHEIALWELGIVEPEQFEWAVRVAQPNIAVVTNIGEAHLAKNGDKYLIANTKVELVRRLPKDGYAVLNIDDELVSWMASFAPTPNVIKFGLNKNATFNANNIEHLGPDGIVFTVNGYYKFHLPIYTSALIYNALAAIAVARIFNIEFPDIQRTLQKNFSVLPHRGNLIKTDDFFILDHTYDATINSVTKACESLVQFKRFSKKVVLVIGDISNPGPAPKEIHQKMGYYIAALPIDVVVTIGKYATYIAKGIKQMNHTKKTIVACRNTSTALKKLQEILSPQSTLLFIGSQQLALYNLLEEFLQQV